MQGFFKSAPRLQNWANRWAECLPAGLFLLLDGELGSGKTTFVQGLARGLGIVETVTSPTFALIHAYPEGVPPLIHCDLYRLEPEQVWGLGLQEDNEGGITVIEWAQRLPFTPRPVLWLNFTIAKEGRWVRGTAISPREKGLLAQAQLLYENEGS
ncbi:tRNA (adenosine(37)-N6)-threonylcarbamoyltransferase complex ATPase subunit type 1 TsaE [Candidatus Cyanaurora vandensis]|uniref:tRNA (adenosine(37)-N6)-threonylcarbamoyltransferase complex ATPase subunit type 1 TsaE n=1 Tax=Candidatus Cyanaurora vandensis TaxID=2714958 RepID=UPI00257F1E6F|nr:tRNA (adenosine(37)-N6)-threonylcarbamoyltransferase complex ATPase subunit type 1 TsaE [Candidatus Cyanaurora vandensis]